MKDTLVDSSVLIDILTEDREWCARSSVALAEAMNSSAVVINPIIFAEVSTRYKSFEQLDRRLPTDLYRRDEIPFEAAFLAGRAFLKYRRRGGQRASAMPDFYIGAHAEIAGFRVLSRDPRRFRQYFPSVELVVP